MCMQRNQSPSSDNWSAVLEANGQSYYLKEGKNIIGRKTPISIHSNTDVQIVQVESIDHTISRKHCNILVHTSPDGTKTAYLRPVVDRTLTLVNDTRVYAIDLIRLPNGAKIQLGTTVFTFKLL